MSEAKQNPADQEYQPDQILAHDFDGIQEFDNRLPNWWLWILWGSVIFSLAYWLFFHTFGIGKLPAALFDREMQVAAEAQIARAAEGGLNDESLLLMSTLPERVAEGEKLWVQYCVVCHSLRGEGLVGSNLTDAYWIHGATPMEIHKVVTDGVLAKGMAAWGRQLGPRRVENVVAYVLTLKGSNVPGKAPEGELIRSRGQRAAQRLASQREFNFNPKAQS